MKKCASCTKDLPEAALHCVFCGAKQPPAPAVQQGLAKTAFGYSANEVMDQLGRPNNPAQAPTYQPPTSTSPYQQQRSHSPSQAPMQQPMQQPSYAQKTIAADIAPRPQFRPMPPGVVPASDPNAATVAVPTSQAPAHGPPMPQAAPVNMYSNQPPPQVQLPPHMAPSPYQQQPYQQQPYQQQPMQQPYGAGPMPGGMGINAPNPHTPPPLQPMMAGNPYLGAQGASALVVEPWRESLKLVMFVWGAVLLVVFAVPKATEPQMVFQWTGLDGLPGKQLLLTVLYPAIGFLAVVAAALPMQALARGIIAGVLGLAGVAVPLAMGGTPGWHEIVGVVGFVTLVPGLLVRNEYTESMVARVLVTVGVVCFLLPYLVPSGGELKLVNLFKQVIDAPGKGKVPPLIEIIEIVLIVMSLLAWMPGPATGGAKLIAWAIIIWTTAVHHVIDMLVGADDVGALFKQPAALVEWALLASLMALIGYGTATVVGKQLE